jgi:PEP-CTERM motif
MKLVIILGLAGILGFSAAEAGPITFAGTLFYTNWTGGGTNVNSISYSYDQGTQALTLGSVHGIATTPGADGIIFAPNGDLLVGGQGTGKVYDVNPTTGTFTSVSPGSPGADQSSYHLSLDPTGTQFFTSNFGGALDIVPLPFGTQGSTRSISGGDSGLTQIAFAPVTGNVFYVNGQPNGGGNLGTINLTTGVTIRLFTGILPAHGLIYDPFTGLMTIFGAGETGTFDQSGGNLKTSSSMACDFDQGAVDGQGHALVAGCNSITFIDYSLSHDITHPDKVIVTPGFNFIDDVAPLVGAGSGGQTPEPSTVLLVGSGIAVLVFLQRKNATTKANR